jgi:hypothetical protein
MKNDISSKDLEPYINSLVLESITILSYSPVFLFLVTKQNIFFKASLFNPLSV